MILQDDLNVPKFALSAGASKKLQTAIKWLHSEVSKRMGYVPL